MKIFEEKTCELWVENSRHLTGQMIVGDLADAYRATDVVGKFSIWLQPENERIATVIDSQIYSDLPGCSKEEMREILARLLQKG